MFIPYLDLKKLASHPFIFAPTCYRKHWWIWMVDVKNKKFHVLNPYHKKCLSEIKMKLNIFVISFFCFLYKFLGFCLCIIGSSRCNQGYVISRMRDNLSEKRLIKLNRHMSTLRANKRVYLMKWIEIIKPESIKKGKYVRDNWMQGYVISRMRDNLSGKRMIKLNRHMSTLRANKRVYLMKWIEIIKPESIKKGKYVRDNWMQVEVDHFIVEYTSLILLMK
ncbi:hypothetical protein Ahy_B10g102782 [Arachis hypogaea]|uniref:Ubiquitin-like protease family profile domain-containing protein n=1 Tax=Arachis hypogaea TaxID=3818 RepID=A0A444X2J4_ARAHY|nr:hypothetical protein Ahy_B10g102782 [Arachis hypogaea]